MLKLNDNDFHVFLYLNVEMYNSGRNWKQQQSTFEWCLTWVGQSSVSWRSNSSQISQKSLGGTALPRKKTKNLLEKSLSSTWTKPRWRWSRRTRRGCRRTRRAPAWSSGRRSCAACPRSRSSGTRPFNKDLIQLFWKLFVRSHFSLGMPLESHPWDLSE